MSFCNQIHTAFYISYSFAIVLRFHGLGSLKEEEFILSYSSRGMRVHPGREE